MMRLGWFSLLIFSTLASSIICEFPDRNQTEKFQKILKKFEDNNHVPCLTAGFVQEYPNGDMENFYETIGGVSDVENESACGANAVFRIAGLSKAIESILTAKMIENKTLSWNDDIHQWISKEVFPIKQWNGHSVNISLTNLLSHQSGIRATILEDVMHYWESRIFNTTQTISFFAKDPLVGQPETRFVYSNNGINLVAAIIESIENRPYKEIMSDFVQEFGLVDTQMENAFKLIQHRVTQYKPGVDSNGKFQYLPAPITDDLRPYPHWAAEGLISTVGDVLLFSQKLLDIYQNRSTLLKKETLEFIWNAKTAVNAGKTSMIINDITINNIETNYVLGWQRYDFPKDVPESFSILSNLTMMFHTAQFESTGAILAIFPEKLFTISFLTNLGEMDDKLCELAVESFLDLYNAD